MPTNSGRDFPPYARRQHESFCQTADTSTKGHGRHARYRLQTTTRLSGSVAWPGLAQVCRLTRRVKHRGGETLETAYAITSVPRSQADASCLLQWWINHWHIENRLHWVRDTAFREDHDRVRDPNAGHVLAALRNAAINHLRLQKEPNITAALRENAYRNDQLFAKLGILKN